MLSYIKGLPWWLRRKRICLQCSWWRFDPWVRKIPWRRKWQPNPWTEEPGAPQSTGSQTVRHDWAHTLIFSYLKAVIVILKGFWETRAICPQGKVFSLPSQQELNSGWLWKAHTHTTQAQHSVIHACTHGAHTRHTPKPTHALRLFCCYN